ncbi:MAG: hypothetical protein ACE5F6_20865 [Anaerolineae bacterium]
MNSVHVSRRLMQAFTAIGLKASKPQRRNLAMLCYALAVSPNCHLATLALNLPIQAQRDSLVQRLYRLLINEHLHPWRCYQPLVRHLFAHWTGREVSLILDRTDIEDRWSILVLGAAYRKRVLPIAWEVLPFGGTSAARQMALLKQVQPALPPLRKVRVHLYADSEFRAVSVQQMAQGYGWHWHIGLKSDMLFHPGDGHWRPLRSITPPSGEWYPVPDVILTRDHAFGPVNLMAYQPPDATDTPRYWSLDQPVNKHAWRRGRKRFWVEPTFRDWKSYGFDLECTQIDDPQRLDVLMLGIATTTVWLIHVGDWLTRHGRRHWLEAEHRNDYSIFRLGRDHLQRTRTIDCTVPIGFTVSHAT